MAKIFSAGVYAPPPEPSAQNPPPWIGLMEFNLRCRSTFDGRLPLIELDLWWKITFDERLALLEDDHSWNITLYDIQSLMDNDLNDLIKNNHLWKRGFGGRSPLKEAHLFMEVAHWWMMFIHGRPHLIEENQNFLLSNFCPHQSQVIGRLATT